MIVKLGTNSVEVILVHCTIFSIVRVFLAFNYKNFYSILKFRYTPRFVVYDITFGPWSGIVKSRPLLQPTRLQKRLGFRPLTNEKKMKDFILGLHDCICISQ